MFLDVFECFFNFYRDFFLRFALLVRLSCSREKLTLFPFLTEEALTKVCGVCRRYGTPNFYYYQSKTGEDPHKQSEYELRRDISEHVDVSFPIYSQVRFLYVLPLSSGIPTTFFPDQWNDVLDQELKSPDNFGKFLDITFFKLIFVRIEIQDFLNFLWI